MSFDWAEVLRDWLSSFFFFDGSPEDDFIGAPLSFFNSFLEDFSLVVLCLSLAYFSLPYIFYLFSSFFSSLLVCHSPVPSSFKEQRIFEYSKAGFQLISIKDKPETVACLLAYASSCLAIHWGFTKSSSSMSKFQSIP